MSEQSLTVSFANRQTISDTYWLRMELVEDDDGTMTVGEAADIIDTLYDISICGEVETETAVAEDETPSAAAWDAALVGFDNLPTCEALESLEAGDNGAYEVDIKVWRSHPRSELYKLILSNGTAGAAKMVNERVTEFLEIEDQSSITLDMPIMDDPTITWQDIDGPDINIRGNTLWWEGNATGIIRAEFDTRHDLVHIRVTGIRNTVSQIVVGTVDEQWLGVGWYSGSETGEELTDVQDIECQVLAFYHYQYEELLLHKPEIDESVSAEDQQAVCSYAGSVHVEDDDGFEGTPYGTTRCKEDCARNHEAGSQALADCQKACEKECFKTVKYDVICTCGGDEGEITEEVPVPCPDGYNTGSSVDGGVTEEGGDKYIDCGADDVSKDWFYEEKCCYAWPFGDDIPWPQCEKHYAPFTGQGLTEEQTAALKAKYGADCNIISVGPAEGKCGEIITEQVVTQLGCCDGVSAIVWDSDNSAEVIADNSSGIIFITGGQAPFTWSVRGSGFWADADHTLRDVITDVPQLVVYTVDACGGCTITVTDGCSTANGYVRSSNGQWVQISTGCPSDVPLVATENDAGENTALFYAYWDGGMMRAKQYCTISVLNLGTCCWPENGRWDCLSGTDNCNSWDANGCLSFNADYLGRISPDISCYQDDCGGIFDCATSGYCAANYPPDGFGGAPYVKSYSSTVIVEQWQC